MAFVCEECQGSFAEPGEALFECSRCGQTLVDERRCPDCNIFMAKVADESCPDCEAPLEGDLEQVRVFETGDGMVHESMAAAEAWIADAPSRAERALEVKADLERRMDESREAARLRGEEWAPRVAAVYDALFPIWVEWRDSLGLTDPAMYLRQTLETLGWIRENLERGDSGGFSLPVSMSWFGLLVVRGHSVWDEQVADVVYGCDYDHPWEIRSEARVRVLARTAAVLGLLSDRVDVALIVRDLDLMEFIGSVYFDVFGVIPVLEEVLR